MVTAEDENRVFFFLCEACRPRIRVTSGTRITVTSNQWMTPWPPAAGRTVPLPDPKVDPAQRPATLTYPHSAPVSWPDSFTWHSDLLGWTVPVTPYQPGPLKRLWDGNTAGDGRQTVWLQDLPQGWQTGYTLPIIHFWWYLALSVVIVLKNYLKYVVTPFIEVYWQKYKNSHMVVAKVACSFVLPCKDTQLGYVTELVILKSR